MMRLGKGAILASAALGLVLGLSGCDDSAANAKANEEAKARTEAAAKMTRLKEAVAHNVECLNALRWQKPALSGAGIGDLKVYEDYYRGKLDQALGSEILPKEGNAPMLTRANTYDYLEWSYPETVKTKFNAGKDANGDGKVSSGERNGLGFNAVTSCVLEVAEMGKGALAGKDKVGRVQKIEVLRTKLKDKGV
jgi:hypothetical protein